MLGVLVNALAIIVGSAAALLFRSGIPKKLNDAIMIGLGLCVTYIGAENMLQEGTNDLALVIGMAIGAVVGTLLDISGALERLGAWAEEKLPQKGKGSVAEGFVTASLLFCIGAMAVTGSINAGQGDNTILFTKAIIDGICALMLTVSLGYGVMLSAVLIFLLQGAIALSSGLIASVLDPVTMAVLTQTGGLLILAIGLNMLGITKIKVADYLPALIFAPLANILLGFIM